MAELDAANAAVTTSTVLDFIVDSKALDVSTGNVEHFWHFEEATRNFGYYFDIPEIKSSARALATYTTGKGITADNRTVRVLNNITGLGSESFQEIMWNMEVVKLIVGDSFAVIIRNDDGDLINLVPISPERVRVVHKNNRILRYDIWTGETWKEKKTHEMLHLMNDRIGDQVHGTSLIDSTKWLIDARNEALRDERLIKHRELAMGILYIDSDNTTKRNSIMTQYAEAVKKGEVLVLPKDTAELRNAPNVTTKDRIAWITYLENFFYQTFGVPRIIATSDGTSEVGGKMGYLIFEPVYSREQTLLEEDLWNQVAIRIKFNRPASLSGVIQDDEQKNTGQIGIQPNDLALSMTRE